MSCKLDFLIKEFNDYMRNVTNDRLREHINGLINECQLGDHHETLVFAKLTVELPESCLYPPNQALLCVVGNILNETDDIEDKNAFMKKMTPDCRTKLLQAFLGKNYSDDEYQDIRDIGVTLCNDFNRLIKKPMSINDLTNN